MMWIKKILNRPIPHSYKPNPTSSLYLHTNKIFPLKRRKTATMSELEKCMESLISVFHRYAAGDGDKATLTKKELKQLLEKEFSTFLSVRKIAFSIIHTVLQLNH